MNKGTLIKQLKEENLKLDTGLSKDMFLFVSMITSLINVNLFVTDN